MRSPVTHEAIERAIDEIHPVFCGSPQFASDALSTQAGQDIVVKLETGNPIGCFKGRGTWLAVKTLVARGAITTNGGLVTVSTGNFGQGVAYAGRAFGLKVVVFVGGQANATKVRRLRLLGAEVRDTPADLSAAYAAAEKAASEENLHFLIDGKEPLLAIGAGTAAVEVSGATHRGDIPPFGTAYVPVGGGSLIGGVGTWLRHRSPATRVVGVQASGAPAMTLSWRTRSLVPTAGIETQADGLATGPRMLFEETLEILLSVVDEMILVSEHELQRAQTTLRDELGITVELSGAASWAGAQSDAAASGEGALIILTGSNIPRLPSEVDQSDNAATQALVSS